MAVRCARYRASRSVWGSMTAANSSAIQGNWREFGNHHAEEPEVFRTPVEFQDHARDQTKHLLDIALRFNAGRKRVLEVARHPQKHLPEDFLLACELVVERPPGHAGSLGEFVHAHRSEAPFQEQARRRPRRSLPAIRRVEPSGQSRSNFFVAPSQKSLLHHKVQCNTRTLCNARPCLEEGELDDLGQDGRAGQPFEFICSPISKLVLHSEVHNNTLHPVMQVSAAMRALAQPQSASLAGRDRT